VYCMFYMVTVVQIEEPWSSYVRKNTHLVLADRERHCVAGQKQSSGLFLVSLGKICDFSGYVQRGVAGCPRCEGYDATKCGVGERPLPSRR
jgi:hypothetical protein